MGRHEAPSVSEKGLVPMCAPGFWWEPDLGHASRVAAFSLGPTALLCLLVLLAAAWLGDYAQATERLCVAFFPWK